MKCNCRFWSRNFEEWQLYLLVSGRWRGLYTTCGFSPVLHFNAHKYHKTTSSNSHTACIDVKKATAWHCQFFFLSSGSESQWQMNTKQMGWWQNLIRLTWWASSCPWYCIDSCHVTLGFVFWYWKIHSGFSLSSCPVLMSGSSFWLDIMQKIYLRRCTCISVSLISFLW